MKIILGALWQPDVDEIIKSNAVLADSIKSDAIVHEFDVDSELFDTFLKLTSKTLGCWFNPIVKFEGQEMNEARLFQVDCRGKLLRETKNDFTFNNKALISSPIIQTDEQTKIHLIDQLAVTNIKIKPNEIACATEWLPEFILSEKVTKMFEAYGLTGFETKPVLNLKTKVYHKGYYHLYTSNVMCKVELDITTIKRADNVGGYFFRELGCLTYNMKNCVFSDFNRTAENWSNNYCPIWVISSRTKKCYEENKLKGWHFRPVLDKESSLHQAYLAKWEEVFRRVSINPLNRID